MKKFKMISRMILIAYQKGKEENYNGAYFFNAL